MESPLQPRFYRRYLQLFALLMALQAALFLHDSIRDPFPQDRLPSLGPTADAVVRSLQHDLSHQRRLAGLQLLMCACIFLTAARALRPAGD